MKNKIILLSVLAILLGLVLGCSSLNPFSGGSKSTDKSASTKPDGEKSTSDEVIEAVVVEKTGVPECDDLIDFISSQAQSSDDNYVAKATREFMFNRIREALRKSIEEDKNKPEELAKKCTEYKTQLETYKAKEDEEKGSQ